VKYKRPEETRLICRFCGSLISEQRCRALIRDRCPICSKCDAFIRIDNILIALRVKKIKLTYAQFIKLFPIRTRPILLKLIL